MSHELSYADKEYWERRYDQSSSEDKYDWYLGWKEIKPIFLPFLNVKEEKNVAEATSSSSVDSSSTQTQTIKEKEGGKESKEKDKQKEKEKEPHDRSTLRVLVVGCGNSELSEQMYKDGFVNIISIDYSETVIKQMQNAYGKDMPQLSFQTMDVRDLRFKDETFDIICDKGTLDAILCGNESAKNSTTMLHECCRVLKRGGVFGIITYGQPATRLPYLEKTKFNWKVFTQRIDKSRYLYVVQKKETIKD
eukprot:TRINITY_DN11737_c0_g1_i1.p1 TRINITY_DN11737_c0_g1~~TRINITY_DN11737_c0_g1_i1.p1  ORF type:complete len:249 (+),score=66.14 TRINITY_DN11737_c0_g1_i1:158-904(+)